MAPTAIPAPNPMMPAAPKSPVLPRGHIGCPVNDRGVVLRDINNLGVSGLNDNDLRRLLHDSDLRVVLRFPAAFALRAGSGWLS